jgi:hypothetical protein
LRRTAVATPGVSAASHFGGGPAAIPSSPVAPRGVRQLVLFCVLATVCMAMIVIGTSRLVLMRRPRPVRAPGYHQPAADAAVSYPAPPPQEWPSTPPGHAGAAEDTRGAGRPGE